jgi:hypothetical protein
MQSMSYQRKVGDLFFPELLADDESNQYTGGAISEYYV